MMTWLTAIGSECFKRLYGGLEQVSPIPLFGSSEGRRLSDEDRATLLENTERLLATLEAEHIQAEKEREAQRLKAEREAAEQLKAAASRILSARAQHRTQKIPPVIDILAGVPAAELAKIRIEATTLVQAENPGVNLEAPGWSGLVEAEIRRIVRRRRYGSSHG